MERTVAYLTERGHIEIQREQIAKPRGNEVLIQIHAIGICGSDISYYTKGSTGMGELEYPHILGHECAGEVIEVGEECTQLKPGDRVTIEPGVPCGTCEYCRTGRYHLCPSISFMSSAVKMPGGEGGMAELVLRPEPFVYKIPENVTYEQAALIEPISVAMHAVEKSGIRPGQSAAILGCGPIAGCLLLVLKAYGVSKVWMTDVVPERTKFMKSIGAEEAFQVSGLEPEELKQLVPEQVDVVFDTTCNEASVNASLHWLKKGGNVTMIGVPTSEKRLDMKTAFVKELSFITSFRYSNTYLPAIALISSGKLHPEHLISQRFPLEKADEAMKMTVEEKSQTMKVVLIN